MFTVYTLEEANISIVDPDDPTATPELSGYNQGSGIHLNGMEITLNNNAWVAVDIVDTDSNFNDSQSGQNLDGPLDYNGVSYSGGERVEAEYTLTVEDPDGNSYTLVGFNINGSDGQPSFGTVEGLAFIGPVTGFPPIGTPLTVVASSEGPNGSGNITPYSSYATPCFTPGTVIATAQGPRRVEDIRAGDLVLTKDAGFQPVRWAGKTDLTAQDLQAAPNLRPVHIPANAFGPGMPVRDMYVSPMHRIGIVSAQVELYFGTYEVLVPASHLVGSRGITQRLPQTDNGIGYVHFAFDHHHLVQSDGIWTESFQPAAQVVSNMERAVRAELETLFPGVSTGATAMQSARRSLKAYEATVLLAA